MIQTKSKKTSPRREPKQSKKPHVSVDVLVDEHCEPVACHLPGCIESEPIEIHSEPEAKPDEPEPDQQPEAVSEHIQEKYGCPCGSSISVKSKSKHEKTKKHLELLEAKNSQQDTQ